MRNRLGLPRFVANGQIFSIIVILTLCWIAFRGCELPALTSEQRKAEQASLAEQEARWQEQRADRARREPMDLAFYILLRLAALALFVGAGAVLILRGLQWAITIYPKNGQHPLFLGRLGGVWKIYNPNLSITAGANLSDDTAILPAPGWEQAQIATTLAAQRVALEAAKATPERLTIHNKGDAAALTPMDEIEPVIQWPDVVRLSDLLNRQGGADLRQIILGVSPGDNGEWEIVNPSMSRMVHIGVGSASGFGKSTLLHSILTQFVLAGGVSLALADAEGSTLGKWRNCDLLEWPFAEHADEITALFVEMGKELDRRAELYGQAGNPNNLDEYNQRRGNLPELKPLVLVADEANSILCANQSAANAAESLGYRGRKFGLWLVLSGQRWTKDAIPAGLKNQLSTRVAFRMNSKTDSNNLLMSSDAAGEWKAGHGFAIIPGKGRVEFKAPLVDDSEIATLLTGHTGPRNPAPVVDVTPEQPVNSITTEQRQRIIELGRAGEKPTSIVLDIWGSKNGRRARQVREILDRDAHEQQKVTG